MCVCGHMIRNGGLNPPFMLVIFMTRLKKSGFEFQAFCAFIMCEIWLYFCLLFYSESDWVVGFLSYHINLIMFTFSASDLAYVFFVQILKEDDNQWPEPDRVGRQELEIVMGNEHISFTTSKIGSLVDVQSSNDPEGLRIFYYLVQVSLLVHLFYVLWCISLL